MPTDHYDERRGVLSPSYIIMHYTETRDAEEAHRYFSMSAAEHPGGGRVSTHYMIDQDGAVFKYVDEDKRAWHAGKSYWRGLTDMNSHSIGIELVNPGIRYGYEAFPREQMEALAILARDMIARLKIPLGNILGHSDIAPERKCDPGELFDWRWLSQYDVGLWPEPEERDFKMAGKMMDNPQLLAQGLIKYGYNPDAGLREVITAFQRHFYPDAFERGGTGAGEPCINMAARLAWLLRRKPVS